VDLSEQYLLSCTKKSDCNVAISQRRWDSWLMEAFPTSPPSVRPFLPYPLPNLRHQKKYHRSRGSFGLNLDSSASERTRGHYRKCLELVLLSKWSLFLYWKCISRSCGFSGWVYIYDLDCKESVGKALGRVRLTWTLIGPEKSHAHQLQDWDPCCLSWSD
jgi:hypothetical protein